MPQLTQNQKHQHHQIGSIKIGSELHTYSKRLPRFKSMSPEEYAKMIDQLSRFIRINTSGKECIYNK